MPSPTKASTAQAAMKGRWRSSAPEHRPRGQRRHEPDGGGQATSGAGVRRGGYRRGPWTNVWKMFSRRRWRLGPAPHEPRHEADAGVRPRGQRDEDRDAHEVDRQHD